MHRRIDFNLLPALPMDSQKFSAWAEYQNIFPQLGPPALVKDILVKTKTHLKNLTAISSF